jgi:hypothetical protein
MDGCSGGNDASFNHYTSTLFLDSISQNVLNQLHSDIKEIGWFFPINNEITHPICYFPLIVIHLYFKCIAKLIII